MNTQTYIQPVESKWQLFSRLVIIQSTSVIWFWQFHILCKLDTNMTMKYEFIKWLFVLDLSIDLLAARNKNMFRYFIPHHLFFNLKKRQWWLPISLSLLSIDKRMCFRSIKYVLYVCLKVISRDEVGLSNTNSTIYVTSNEWKSISVYLWTQKLVIIYIQCNLILRIFTENDLSI